MSSSMSIIRKCYNPMSTKENWQSHEADRSHPFCDQGVSKENNTIPIFTTSEELNLGPAQRDVAEACIFKNNRQLAGLSRWNNDTNIPSSSTIATSAECKGNMNKEINLSMKTARCNNGSQKHSDHHYSATLTAISHCDNQLDSGTSNCCSRFAEKNYSENRLQPSTVQSKSQSKNKTLSERYCLDSASDCGGGSNQDYNGQSDTQKCTIMESRVNNTSTVRNSTPRTFYLKNRPTINSKAPCDNSLCSAVSKNLPPKCRTKTSNRRSNFITISSASTSSLIPLFVNFILFSTFLLNGFYLSVQGEILSAAEDSNNLRPYNENISLTKLSHLTYHTHRNDYNHDNDNHGHGIKVKFNNNSIYSTLSHSQDETNGKEETSTAPIQSEGEILRDLLSQPLDSLDKTLLLKTLWDALTPEEIHRIFGHHQRSSSVTFNSVPNFDVTKPKITHRHNEYEAFSNGKRSRRSAQSSEEKANYTEYNSDTNDSLHKQQSTMEKTIQLEGLGREFTLNIYPNQKLLDPFFVHLHRHKNQSHILPQELAQKQLNCFYHGSVTHRGKEDDDLESGAVAMSLCGGMKGFILPVSTSTSEHDDIGHRYHYVIHPLPDRLLKPVGASDPADQEENESANEKYQNANNEGHNRHHFIFRRDGTIYPHLAPRPLSQKSSLKSNTNENIHTKNDQANINNKVPASTENYGATDFPTCMHHDTPASTASLINHLPNNNKKVHTKHKSESNEKDYNYKKSRSGDNARSVTHNGNNELDPQLAEQMDTESSATEILNQEYRMLPIISVRDDASEYYTGINDLESLTEKETRQYFSALSPTSDEFRSEANSNEAGHNFRRQKRSTTGITNFDTETIDPFTYKPVNVAPDSYWIQYRDRGLRSSIVNSAGTINNHNAGSRRLSSQFSYDGVSGPSRFTGTSPSDPSSFQPSFWLQNPRHLVNVHDNGPQHNLPSRPARGSRYDEIPTGPEFDEQVASSDHMTWSKGILVFESSGSDEDRHYPGKDVPFYTKNSANKRKTKGISSSSSIVSRTSSTSSKGGSNTRSFDWFNGGIADSGSSGSSNRQWNSADKNRTTKGYSANDPIRKGRRDDGVFGDKWKSSLDSEIIWADRSNEINKQSRFEDLSNVKDRPPSHLTIETAVFVDKDLYKHMKQNFPEDTQGEVTRIVLAMINAVQLLYQDPSLGHRVDFVLKRLEVLESDPPSLIRPYDIDRFLTNFCKWQKTENPPSDADPLHWDHALILTGLDLYVVHQSGKISNQVVGLAPVAGMCTKSSSCTVNEGRHFESVFVVAHEIGHNLGMRHDGPQAENNCDPTSHIMSPTLGSGKITWSPCSKKYLDLFLETNQAKCLFDKAKPERWLDHNGDGRLPGERFDADRQCVLKYGRGSFHAAQQPLEDVCRDLHCRREFFTWTSHPALDGTRCSANDDMWCRSGKCVPKLTGPGSTSSLGSSYDISGLSNNKDNHNGFSGGSNHLPGSETAAYVTQKALDGGWGKWSPYTDCSTACLYSDDGTLTMGSNGVRLAARRCDSPRPENGGRQCNGPDRRYKTCAAHKICTKSPTRTTVSQYATEVCSRAAQVDTELTGRGYMSSSNDVERACSVWCETNDNSGPRSRGWSFPDGTSCKLMSLPKAAQTFCVAGKCQEFTCNPYSHFRLSEDDCVFTSSNDVIPSKSSDNRRFSEASNSGVKINHRSGKVGWTDWEIQSECKLACLAPAKGLQLVKRQCASDDALCSGLSLSVRLCKPDKYTVQTNGCSRLQTPFEYATKVCSKYSDKVAGLSGIGMQLSPTKDDIDRPCRIGCQDASIAYRFYMVNGEEGWFPAGTDCSRGDQDKKAYCMAGKCVDFGDDDTPLYQLNNNMMDSLFQLPQQPRNKRQATYNIMEPLKTDPSMDESSLKKLVHKFSQETGNYPSIIQRSRSSVDFSRPIFVTSSSTNNAYNSGFKNGQPTYSYPNTNDIFPNNQKDSRINRGRSLDMDFVDVKSELEAAHPGQATFAHRSGAGLPGSPIEGSFYEWRKIVSDCSVACGAGIQEVIVQCVSGDTVVNDSLCQGRPRPGYSGYINCYKACARSSSSSALENGRGSTHLWNWIQSILPPKNMSYINNRSH